jgi:protein-L-isoaspartate(D-aspartate) O-methyltransferase
MTTNNTGVTTHPAARDHLVAQLRRQGIPEWVLAAFAKVPRERFLPEELRPYAYEDRPLPIGEGQTISQPYMIALILQELDPANLAHVLDVGTGSGYQAALLAELGGQVVSVERIPALAEQARATLHELGYANIEVEVTTEGLGWPPGAPYDAIVVAAAAPRVPYSLVDQLADGGRLIIPVGDRRRQYLTVVDKRPEGLRVSRGVSCGFVPLIARDAFVDDGES